MYYPSLSVVLFSGSVRRNKYGHTYIYTARGEVLAVKLARTDQEDPEVKKKQILGYLSKQQGLGRKHALCRLPAELAVINSGRLTNLLSLAGGMSSIASRHVISHPQHTHFSSTRPNITTYSERGCAMSKCFEPWPSASQEARVLDWLASVPLSVGAPTSIPTSRARKRVMAPTAPTTPTTPTTPPATTPDVDDEHFAKRRRLSLGQDGRERRGDGGQPASLLDEQQTTPRQSAPETETLPLHTRPAPDSPTRRRSRGWRSAAVKTTLDLQQLQVPVWVRGIADGRDAKDKLPADILPLYKSVRSVAIHRKAFIPAEVRQDIEAAYGDDAQTHWFRPSDESTATARQANAELRALRSLLAAADRSKTLSRYEDAWNAEVHLPILKLAVSGRHGLDEDEDGQQRAPDDTQAPEVAAELVTSATITADAIPRFSVLGQRVGMGAEEEGSVLACSVSQSGVSNATSGSGSAEQHSKKGSKKVDLVLVLVPTPSSRLHDAIARQFGSVNQSLYGPLLRNPIACSIETKTTAARTDPTVQLGIWTVAWYRRMDTIWRSVHGEDTAGRPTIVSLPLITVVDHEWNLYYAVDGGDHIVRC